MGSADDPRCSDRMAIAVNEESEARHNLLTKLLTASGAENFITEVFCWLLNNTGFGKTFRDKLRDKLMETCDATVPDVGAGCTWITQKSYSYRLDGTEKKAQPDMVCESADRKTALIFEHKVDAFLHDRQLENYRRMGEERFKKNYKLILITKNRSQGNQEPDCHLLWRQVHGWLETAIDDTEDAGALIARNFLALLEERGLGPMEKITVEQLEAFPLVRVGEQRIKQLVERVAWEDLILKLATDFQDETSKTDLNKLVPDFRWGRYGVYIFSGEYPDNWSPGVFVGVMLHSRDHGPLSDNDQPVACLIVDVAEKWHNQYETSDEYSKLVGALESVVTNGWELHKPEPNSKPRNPWHPLTIYKPLEAVLRPAQTGDKQVDRFVKEVHKVTEKVLKLDEFREFRRWFQSFD